MAFSHLPLATKPLRKQQDRVLEDDDKNPLHKDPHFHLRKETTHSELFYDLFFVADLTVFTFKHNVTDLRGLNQYISFVGLLWLTWYQVALYDVRFCLDCLESRIFRTLQFGVMLIFAAVGPQFNIGEESDERGRPTYPSLRALTLGLMASRTILALQYTQTGYFFYKCQRPSLKPMILLVATYICAAVAYGALYTASNQRQSNYEDLAWYFVAMLETVVIIWTSCKWRFLNYKGTHLVQRMCLLTSIILGEGAIALAKQCQIIAEASTFLWTATNVGSVASGVLILYFLYMVCFDWIEEELYFGYVRE